MPGMNCSTRNAGDLVARIVRPAQHREQILDVRGLEELQAAVLHERNVALRQLDFEHVAVSAGAEQTRPGAAAECPLRAKPARACR